MRLALLAGTALVASPAGAATITWDAGTGDWFTPSNWLPAEVPDGNDAAFVNNGGTAQAAAGSDITVQSFSVGRTTVGGATANGTVEIGGNLTAAFGFGAVGMVTSGDGSLATGSLTVGGTLTGLNQIGVVANDAFNPAAAPSNATGTVVVQGDLNLAAEFRVGRALFGGSVATGAVSVPTGTIRTQASAFPFWEIGVGTGATATGTVTAAAVDTSAQALTSLSVGFGNQGGTGIGTLNLGSGDLRVSGDAAVGVAFDHGGASADGTLALGGTLRGEGADRRLDVGGAFGTFLGGAGSATGSIEAQGIEGFRFVTIGTASANDGGVDPGTGDPLVSATGAATIGAGGIVNTTTPGSLNIGFARGVAVNNTLVGPGPAATGAASVAGDITGYNLVEIGRVEATGRGNGSLDLANGTLSTSLLRIGTVEGAGSNVTLTDGVTDAVGRLSVTDGAIDIALSGSLGRTEVGAMLFADPSITNSAQGTLELTRSSLTGGFLDVGVRGGQGTLTATEGSTIEVNSLSVGTNGGIGTVTLQDGTLAVHADAAFPGTGAAFIGSNGGSGVFAAARSTVTIDRFLSIASFGAASPNQARVTLTDSTLTVGELVGIGVFDPGSRGELSLVNSMATVGTTLRLGFNANNGQLFGEAMLEVRSSLLTIGGELLMDALAAPGLETIFGIDGLARGLGGYGAIDAATATLAGLVTIDFAGLGAPPGVGNWVFDLIDTTTGIVRDFDDVQFLGLAGGYYVSFYGLAENDHVWRVILAQRDPNQVPEPAALALLLFGLAGLGLARRRA